MTHRFWWLSSHCAGDKRLHFFARHLALCVRFVFFFIFIRLSFPFHILNVVGVDCFFLIFSAFILYFFHSLTVVGIDGNSMLLFLWLIYSHCCRFVLLAVLPLLTEMQSSFFASYFYCCCHGKTIYVCVFQRCGKYGDYQFD